VKVVSPTDLITIQVMMKNCPEDLLSHHKANMNINAQIQALRKKEEESIIYFHWASQTWTRQVFLQAIAAQYLHQN
jgi:hypothetical protein